MLERNYQAKLIKKLRALLPGCFILKNDSSYMQGVPDLLVLFGTRWAMLEVKKAYPRPGSDDFEPNQEYYIEKLNDMSFCACIYPTNENEVLRALQSALLA
jgi:hypothetical protein